jgi:phage-related protein (TIGR01555 family)
MSGLAVAMRDKRLASRPIVTPLSLDDVATLHRGNDMAARIINRPVEDALREGWEFIADGDKGALEAFNARVDELDLTPKVQQAWIAARRDGGSLLMPGIDDGAKDLAEPLNERTIKTFSWVTLLTRREAKVDSVYTDPTSPKYGEPEFYRVGNDAAGRRGAAAVKRVHESRVIRFDGVPTSREVRTSQDGWDDSVLLRPYTALRGFGVSWESVEVVLSEFVLTIFRMKGLAEKVAANATDAIQKRTELLNLQKSILRGMLLDADESFERQTVSVAGLADLLDKFAVRLAAAAEIPATILLGQSPAGMNATGESDVRQYYDRVAGMRNDYLRPRLNRLVTLMLRAKTGPTRGREPANWRIAFPPLWQETAKEKAELRRIQSQTDIAYIDAGVLLPDEVAVNRFGGDEYSPDTVIDRAAREAMTSNAPDPADPELPAASAPNALPAGDARYGAPDGPPTPSKPARGA